MKNWQFALAFIITFGLIILILKVFPPPGSKEPGFKIVRMEIVAPKDFICGDKIIFKDVPKSAATLKFNDETLDPETIEYKPKCFPEDKNYKFILTALDNKDKVISKAELVGLYGK